MIYTSVNDRANDWFLQEVGIFLVVLLDFFQIFIKCFENIAFRHGVEFILSPSMAVTEIQNKHTFCLNRASTLRPHRLE